MCLRAALEDEMSIATSTMSEMQKTQKVYSEENVSLREAVVHAEAKVSRIADRC